ncbi:multidomain presynaptic cytomatrix related protein [Rutstroemia sp. NJR-2017a BVV2]|nr:multidomain presynaptic cytomatrix related protein [Rutstroemia sp. NJR-2017a BVV2]
MSNPEPEADPVYTVFIRLPFPRGDFVDPPSVEWDASKDKALWKILSKASKNSDIDCEFFFRYSFARYANSSRGCSVCIIYATKQTPADTEDRATKFEVTLSFLLQQAAWLYERQLSQVRAQMRKVGVSKGSLAPSPIPGSTSETGAGEAMKRTGSGGAGPRIPSALSTRRDSPILKNDGSVPNTPARAMAPPFSRTSSGTVQSRILAPASPRPTHATVHQRSLSPKARFRPVSIGIEQPPRSSPQQPHLPSPSDSDSDSSSSAPVQSRLLRRRFPSAKKDKEKESNENEPSSDSDELAFLPASHDPSATLRGDPRHLSRRNPVHSKKPLTRESQTSDSSTSSSAQVIRKPEIVPLHHRNIGQRRPPTGPLSPRRTAELQSERSDGGTPSMGSSFSDLDGGLSQQTDASVTQSALEEALASNMQAGGGMASRMSTISQALRSRYL